MSNYLVAEEDLDNYLSFDDDDSNISSSQSNMKLTEEIKSKYMGYNSNYLPPDEDEIPNINITKKTPLKNKKISQEDSYCSEDIQLSPKRDKTNKNNSPSISEEEEETHMMYTSAYTPSEQGGDDDDESEKERNKNYISVNALTEEAEDDSVVSKDKKVMIQKYSGYMEYSEDDNSISVMDSLNKSDESEKKPGQGGYSKTSSNDLYKFKNVITKNNKSSSYSNYNNYNNYNNYTESGSGDTKINYLLDNNDPRSNYDQDNKEKYGNDNSYGREYNYEGNNYETYKGEEKGKESEEDEISSEDDDISPLAKMLSDSISWKKKPEFVGQKPPEWNKKFQKLRRLGESYEKFEGLRKLAHDFVYCAETYGRIIISEKCLPNEKKTIKPVGIGGIAGGEKYIIQGILFKFAIDFEGIYGGDEGAMKAAGHELNGLMTYFNQNIEGLHVPLMALIDYRGYRVTAISLLPIGKDTIVYGSFDAGNTVYDSEPKVNEMMEKLGKKMNIKGHIVGGKKKVLIYGPADIEVHKGKGEDERFYVLDFARYMPPQTPKKSQWQKTLYQLLRPEFVQKWKTPLSPDAYSRMGIHDNKVHKAEVKEAYKHLLLETIPNLAKSLDENYFNEHGYVLSELPLVFHEVGVNMRQLGRARLLSKNIDIKIYLFIEALARTMKCQLRALYREKMSQLTVPNDDIFREITVEFLNLVLGNNENSVKSELYWNGPLKEKLKDKFEKILTPEEEDPSFSIKSILSNNHLFMLVNRIKVIMGIKFTPTCDKSLDSGFFFIVSDIVSVDTKVKHINLIDYAGGMALIYKVKETTNDIIKSRTLDIAQEMLARALRSTSGNIETIYQLANVYHKMAEVDTNNQKKYDLIHKASNHYEKVINLSPRHHLAWIKFGDLLLLDGKYDEAEQKYLAVLEFFQGCHSALYALANFYHVKYKTHYSDTESLRKCEERIDECISATVEDSQTTAKAYFLYGSLMDFFLRNPNIKSDTNPEMDMYKGDERMDYITKRAAKFFDTAAEAYPLIIREILKLYPLKNENILYLSELICKGCNNIVSQNNRNLRALEKLEFQSIENLEPEKEKRIFNLFSSCINLKEISFKGTKFTAQVVPFIHDLLKKNASRLEVFHFPEISFEKDFNFDTFFEKLPLLPALIELSLKGFTSIKETSLKIIVEKAENIKKLDLSLCEGLGLDTINILRNIKNLETLDVTGCQQFDSSLFFPVVMETNLSTLILNNINNFNYAQLEKLLKMEGNLKLISFHNCNQLNVNQLLQLQNSKCSLVGPTGYFIPFTDQDFTTSVLFQDNTSFRGPGYQIYFKKPFSFNKMLPQKYTFNTNYRLDGLNTFWEFAAIERSESQKSTKLFFNGQQAFAHMGVMNAFKPSFFGRSYHLVFTNSLPIEIYDITNNGKQLIGRIEKKVNMFFIRITKGINIMFALPFLMFCYIMDGRAL